MKQKHKPNLMLQGTASSVGKSILTAAFCRIFKEDGYRVVPFKSQNMALNSYITETGLEMGRAQVFQAEAAGIKPLADMNPILLKPTGEKSAQVIVRGKVLGNRSAMAYHQMKPSLRETVREAYEALEASADVVLLEGAGSPAEINLQEHDLVNMGMADMVDAPVLLIGDIDRGGVFASLYGTLLLLPEDQRHRVKGLLINKFRGDLEILKPGLKQLEELTGLPVVGVIPYGDFDIEEEDGTAERLSYRPQAAESNALQVAVIRLPRISNFTDFHWLEKLPGVELRYVQRPEEVGLPDMLIIPGTKNTLADLAWLRHQGLDQMIWKVREQGGMVCGICGGFQMLGTWLHDPLQLESDHGSMPGLNLISAETVFESEKTTTQITGRVKWSSAVQVNGKHDQRSILSDGYEVKGYEIHMGQTMLSEGVAPFAQLTDRSGGQRMDGGISADGKVWGTYLHGIFDNEDFVTALLKSLSKSGDSWDVKAMPSFDVYKEAQYDKLAATVRNSVDMAAIYRMMNLSSGDKS
ncbi:cobyric acid synthase [Anoxynatronum sibiricum]|uniref:Cobyric acid synthase n=1 Tax=Anoxynatronum sibiricum TaxID=210623 RepID=A0ABU9VRL9_9CLOT